MCVCVRISCVAVCCLEPKAVEVAPGAATAESETAMAGSVRVASSTSPHRT